MDVKVVPEKVYIDPEIVEDQYTAIDEYTRIRFLLNGHEEQSTHSSADFKKAGEMVQTQRNNGEMYSDRQWI